MCLKMRYPGMSRVRIGTGYIFIFAKLRPNLRSKPGASRCTNAFCNSLEPNPLIQALHIQSQLNTMQAEAEAQHWPRGPPAIS